MGWKLSVAAAISACLSASPAAAANLDNYFPGHSEHERVGAYVGATVSILRSGRGPAAPSLRLGIGSHRQSGLGSTGLIAEPRSSVVELDLTSKRRPELYLGGRSLSAAENGNGWGTGEVILAIAGAAGAVFLITALADSGDDDDDRCLIEPELCD